MSSIKLNITTICNFQLSAKCGYSFIHLLLRSVIMFQNKEDYYVVAYNCHGCYYSLLFLYLFVLEVPNPVASVTVSPTSQNQLTVSWDTPPTDNQSPCPATDYLVTYDLINLEQCEEVSRGFDTLNTTATTITIDRLEAFSTYRVTVTSINQAGSSTPVSRTMTTTQSSKS